MRNATKIIDAISLAGPLDTEKIIAFPGFNVAADKHVIDVSLC